MTDQEIRAKALECAVAWCAAVLSAATRGATVERMCGLEVAADYEEYIRTGTWPKEGKG